MSGKEEEGKFKKKEEVVVETKKEVAETKKEVVETKKEVAETKDTKTPEQIKDEKEKRYNTLTEEIKKFESQISNLDTKIKKNEELYKEEIDKITTRINSYGTKLPTKDEGKESLEDLEQERLEDLEQERDNINVYYMEKYNEYKENLENAKILLDQKKKEQTDILQESRPSPFKAGELEEKEKIRYGRSLPIPQKHTESETIGIDLEDQILDKYKTGENRYLIDSHVYDFTHAITDLDEKSDFFGKIKSSLDYYKANKNFKTTHFFNMLDSIEPDFLEIKRVISEEIDKKIKELKRLKLYTGLNTRLTSEQLKTIEASIRELWDQLLYEFKRENKYLLKFLNSDLSL